LIFFIEILLKYGRKRDVSGSQSEISKTPNIAGVQSFVGRMKQIS